MSTPKYTAFHRDRVGTRLYPSEFLIRTMLGRYPHLSFNRDYAGKHLLDLGFGDGRNLDLLCSLGATVYGIEPEPEVCSMVSERVEHEGLVCDLRAGSNARIPFDDGFFDYVVASHSLYYVAEGDTFETNLREVLRVMRRGGTLIATFPDADNFIVRDAVELGDGHVRITADPFELRNGTVFRIFRDRDEIAPVFEPAFEGVCIATFRDDWYGMLVSGFVVVARKA